MGTKKLGLCKGLAFLILVAVNLSACSKDEESSTKKTLILDLNKPEYVTLKTVGHSLTVENVIILNWDNYFYAATTICPYCGNSIEAGLMNDIWRCPSCGSRWYSEGYPARGPATQWLKIYPAQRSGDIVTIVLSL